MVGEPTTLDAVEQGDRIILELDHAPEGYKSDEAEVEVRGRFERIGSGEYLLVKSTSSYHNSRVEMPEGETPFYKASWLREDIDVTGVRVR